MSPVFIAAQHWSKQPQPALGGSITWPIAPVPAASSILLGGGLHQHLPATNPPFPSQGPAASDGATQLLSVLGAVTAAQSAAGAVAHTGAGIAGAARTLQHLCQPSAAAAAAREQAAVRPTGSAFKPVAPSSKGMQEAAPAGTAGTAGVMLIRPVARRPSAPLPLPPVSPERAPSCPSGTTVTGTTTPADASPRSCSSTLGSRPTCSDSRVQRVSKRKRQPRPAEEPATQRTRAAAAAQLEAAGPAQDGSSPMCSPKGEPQISASSSGRGSNASAATVAACASYSAAPSPAQVTWAMQMYAQHYELRQRAAAVGAVLPELPPEVAAILTARLCTQMQS